MSGPLDGIKVVECTQWFQGPAAGSILGDLGAEVIKIEPRVGDPGRGFMRVTAASTRKQSMGSKSGRNFIFACCNRNKRSITLDLQKQKARDIAHKLVEKADIFLHNLRLDVPPKLGLDYETLSPLNPRLIYAQSSGWGPEGPDALKPAFEWAGMARTGWLYFAGEPDSPPLIFASMLGDQTGAILTVQGILAALFARERLGVGQKVDTSLFGSLIFLGLGPISSKLMINEEFPRRSRRWIGNPLFNNYQCGDGKWLCLVMLQADRYWGDLCKVMAMQELEKDPKFHDLEARSTNSEEIIAIMDKIFATKPRDEWLRLLKEGGDFIYAPVETTSALVNDPQALANKYLIDFNHPSWGPTKLVGFPVSLSQTPASVRLPEPELGQHTEEILLEMGYDWDTIAKFREEEVV